MVAVQQALEVLTPQGRERDTTSSVPMMGAPPVYPATKTLRSPRQIPECLRGPDHAVP